MVMMLEWTGDWTMKLQEAGPEKIKMEGKWKMVMTRARGKGGMKETLDLVQLDYPSHASPTVRKQFSSCIIPL